MIKIIHTISLFFISMVLQAQCVPNYGFPTKQVQLDSTNLNYIDEGNGPVLLFIHGLGGNASHWKKNIQELSKHNRCIAIDLPGYGQSTVVNRKHASEQLNFYADQLASFLRKLKINKLSIVGHSMGGQIAIIFSLKYSVLVSKLILLAPAGFETFSTTEAGILTTYATQAFYEKQDSVAIVKSYRMNFYNMPADANVLINERIALKQCTGFALYCAQIPLGVKGMLAYPIKDQLKNIQAPTMILFGSSDALIPNKLLHPSLTVDAVASIANAIPHHQIQFIPQAGHLVQFEKPTIVNQTILQFLHQLK